MVGSKNQLHMVVHGYNSNALEAMSQPGLDRDLA